MKSWPGILASLTLVAVMATVAGVVWAFAGTGSGTVNAQAAPTLAAGIDMIPDGTPCQTIDAVRDVTVGTASFSVDACLENVNDPTGVAIIDASVNYDDSVIKAPEVANVTPGFPDNPNLDVAQVGPGWDCTGLGLAFPTGDTNTGAPGPGLGVAKIGCFTLANPAPWQTGTGRMFSINFDVLGAAGTSSSVVFGNGQAAELAKGLAVNDGGGGEIGSCNPSLVNPMPCSGGTVNIVAAPPTSTPTETPIATSTATPGGVNLTATPSPTLTPVATNTVAPTSTSVAAATATATRVGGGQAGAGVRLPSTGSGGGSGPSDYLPIALAVIGLAAAGGGLLFLRTRKS